MAKKSKNLRAALEKIDSTKAYSVEEAVALRELEGAEPIFLNHGSAHDVESGEEPAAS